MRLWPYLLALALAGAAAWLYTPDRSRAALEAKYQVTPAEYRLVAGIRLHLKDTGPRDARALMLLHGFGASLQTWDGWAARLSSTYRVIRFDLPGFGLTGPDPTGDYSDARSDTILLALMNDLGLQRATLIGNSMGGRLAWHYAAAHPDRVDRLVLISPDGFASPGFEYGKPPEIPWLMRLLPYVLPRPMLRASLAPAYANPARLSDATLTRYSDMMRVPGNRAAILARTAQVHTHRPPSRPAPDHRADPAAVGRKRRHDPHRQRRRLPPRHPRRPPSSPSRSRPRPFRRIPRRVPDTGADLSCFVRSSAARAVGWTKARRCWNRVPSDRSVAVGGGWGGGVEPTLRFSLCGGGVWAEAHPTVFYGFVGCGAVGWAWGHHREARSAWDVGHRGAREGGVDDADGALRVVGGQRGAGIGGGAYQGAAIRLALHARGDRTVQRAGLGAFQRLLRLAGLAGFERSARIEQQGLDVVPRPGGAGRFGASSERVVRLSRLLAVSERGSDMPVPITLPGRAPSSPGWTLCASAGAASTDRARMARLACFTDGPLSEGAGNNGNGVHPRKGQVLLHSSMGFETTQARTRTIGHAGCGKSATWRRLWLDAFSVRTLTFPSRLKTGVTDKATGQQGRRISGSKAWSRQASQGCTRTHGGRAGWR